MNSRDRVHAALRRQPVDRVPIFMWFHPETAKALGRLLEIPPCRVGDAMGNDVHQAWVGNNYAMEGIVHDRDGETHVDDWGIEWVKEGPFNQIRRSPLSDADDPAIRAYHYPYTRLDNLLRNMEPVIAQSADFFIGCDISPCLFEMICRLRGMENAIVDLAASPERFAYMLEQASEFAVRLGQAACERFSLDWLWTGDDVGGQQAMLINPVSWRQLIRPYLARVFRVAKSRGLWLAYHSCGAIRPIVPDLIEMGLDVLNPVQCNCPGMNPMELKREFGKALAFMGGVDTQVLLVKGTAGDVRRETDRLLEVMTADGGGYILAASHCVPPESPLDNIFAMFEAAGIGREDIFDRAADMRRTPRCKEP